MELAQICVDNHKLEAALFLKRGRTGGNDALPEGWQEHPGCDMCAIMTRSALYKAPSIDLRANAADPNTEYAFTLTVTPDYVLKKPLDEVARMIMEYGLTNKPYEKASQYAYVLEHTDKGTPHIHGVYKTPSGRRIAAKYFKRYHTFGWIENPKEEGYKKLGNGHIGGYHAKARHSESYENYLKKEGTVIKSLPPV